MASSAYHRKQTLDQALEQAERDGFKIVKEKDSKTACRVSVSHATVGKKITVNAFKKAERAPGNLIAFLGQTSKSVRQFEAALNREAEKARKEQEKLAAQEPDRREFAIVSRIPQDRPTSPQASDSQEESEPSFAERVASACETLVCWLDDQIKSTGLVQFTIHKLNVQARARLGLPIDDEGNDVLRAALDHLVEKNILRRGKLPAPNSHRQLLAFRLSDFKDTTIMDVFAGRSSVPPPPRPDRNLLFSTLSKAEVAEKATAPAPTPAPKPAAPASPTKSAPAAPAQATSNSFGAALIAEMAKDEDQAIDMMILNGHYEGLVNVIVGRKDVAAGVKVLKRVAELSAKGAMGGV